MHEGHRQRMYDKLMNGDTLYDHEILEIFLFSACPRKNTNPIAHSLLDNFGTIAGVLEADEQKLMTVKGVGKGIAQYIKVQAEIFSRISRVNAGIAAMKNYDEIKTFVAVRMRGRREEALELYCVDKGGKVKRIVTFTNEDISKVEVGTDQIADVLAKEKPHSLLVAHNHLSGNSAPSTNDDRFTKEIQTICSINKIKLIDHCIYASDDNIYSYFIDGKLEGIAKNFSYKSLIDAQIKRQEEEDKK